MDTADSLERAQMVGTVGVMMAEMARKISTAAAVWRVLGEEMGKEVPVFAALGTTGHEGAAYTRMVVVRGVDAKQETVWLSSHCGAQKVEHLRLHPTAEVVIWLPEQRMQIRLRSNWRVIDGAVTARMPGLKGVRMRAWDQHSAATRLMFFHPTPMRPLDAKGLRALKQRMEMVGDVQMQTMPPMEFALLVGTVERMDVLRVAGSIHERWIHAKGQRGWKSERVTP